MSQASPPVPEHERSPFPADGWTQIGTGLAMVAVMVAGLALMGRHSVCPCGTVSLWQVSDAPEQNSQQFADWYSLLHVAFGMGLFAAVRALRAHWTLGAILLAMILGHSIWELAENTPVIIGMFSGGANAPHYDGDSILNSLGDTVFALGGASAMPFLPKLVAIGIVLAIEIVVSVGANDGFVIGTLRLLGVPL